MKRIVATLLLALVLHLSGEAQILITDPLLPTPSQPVIVYFDATMGTQGLLNYTGDVYAHTGLITDKSTNGTDWKYVKTNWAENTPETKLTRESANLYSLQITPNIRDYFGIPESETITHLAFVFRNEDGSKTGKDEGNADIFAEVFEEGLQVKIQDPIEEALIVNLNNLLRFEAVATLADTMAIYLNGEFRKGVGPVNEITDTLPTGEFGEFEVVVWAADQENEVRDTLVYIVRSEPVVEELPDGVIDGINYLSETSVILSLFAPGKDYVFAIGDFSEWYPRESYYMKKTPDGNRFWIRIDNLEPGEIYRFYYLVDGDLPMPDPNTELLTPPRPRSGDH